MSTGTWIALAGLLVGIVTIYMAVWSKYGVGMMLEKSFGDLRTAGAQLATNIDKRMGDLVEIIKFLATKDAGTIEVELTNLGRVEVSTLDIDDSSISYRVVSSQPTFRSSILTRTADRSEAYQTAEKDILGDVEIEVRIVVPTSVHIRIPCTDIEICGRFMAFLLRWLDDEYFVATQEIRDAENEIERHLDLNRQQGPSA